MRSFPAPWFVSRGNAWMNVVPTARESMLGVLCGAWVSEGWASDTRAGFNNTDRSFFDDVVYAYDALVGGPRYVSSRHTRVDRKQIFELDIQNLAAFRNGPLAELVGSRAADKFIPDVVWRGGWGVQTSLPHGVLRGRRWSEGGRRRIQHPLHHVQRPPRSRTTRDAQRVRGHRLAQEVRASKRQDRASADHLWASQRSCIRRARRVSGHEASQAARAHQSRSVAPASPEWRPCAVHRGVRPLRGRLRHAWVGSQMAHTAQL